MVWYFLPASTSWRPRRSGHWLRPWGLGLVRSNTLDSGADDAKAALSSAGGGALELPATSAGTLAGALAPAAAMAADPDVDRRAVGAGTRRRHPRTLMPLTQATLLAGWEIRTVAGLC